MGHVVTVLVHVGGFAATLSLGNKLLDKLGQHPKVQQAIEKAKQLPFVGKILAQHQAFARTILLGLAYLGIQFGFHKLLGVGVNPLG